MERVHEGTRSLERCVKILDASLFQPQGHGPRKNYGVGRWTFRPSGHPRTCFPRELVFRLRSCPCPVFVVPTRSVIVKFVCAQHMVYHMKQRWSPHFTLLTRAHFRLDADQICKCSFFARAVVT